MAKYDQPTWGVAAAIDEMNGGAGSWAALGLTSSDLTDRRTTLNGYYKFGSVKLSGGVMTRNNMGSAATPKSDLTFFGVTYPVTPTFVLDAQLSQLTYKDSSNKAQLFVARGTYTLASGLVVYAGLGQIANEGASAISVSSGASGSNPVAGGSQTGIVGGLRYAF
jgi:predicted porin